jgi:hypothetical protein
VRDGRDSWGPPNHALQQWHNPESRVTALASAQWLLDLLFELLLRLAPGCGGSWTNLLLLHTLQWELQCVAVAQY